MGKTGLALGVQYARKGQEVVGVDVSARVVELVNAGLAPFPGESGLDSLLKEVIADVRLTATTDAVAATPAAPAVVVVLPLVVHPADVPDFGPLDATTRPIPGRPT